MRLRWTRPAQQDLIDILDDIAAENPPAALATIDRIEPAARQLVEFPLTGREGSVPETRELPIPSLPFLIVYRVFEGTVEVLRVIHGARQWPPVYAPRIQPGAFGMSTRTQNAQKPMSPPFFSLS